MNMKWNPIVNGDLSGVPRDTRLLVTRINNGRLYVDFGYLESILEKHAMIEVGDVGTLVKAEDVVAWMEIPEPYQPDRCDICNQCRVFIDGSGTRWSKCELMGIATFVPLKCPLKK